MIDSPDTTTRRQGGSSPSACSALDALASIVEMPTEHIREAGDQMKTERMKRRLLEKVNLIRAGNTAILPTGEIVARGTTGSMDYDSPNTQVRRQEGGESAESPD